MLDDCKDDRSVHQPEDLYKEDSIDDPIGGSIDQLMIDLTVETFDDVTDDRIRDPCNHLNNYTSNDDNGSIHDQREESMHGTPEDLEQHEGTSDQLMIDLTAEPIDDRIRDPCSHLSNYSNNDNNGSIHDQRDTTAEDVMQHEGTSDQQMIDLTVETFDDVRDDRIRDPCNELNKYSSNDKNGSIHDQRGESMHEPTIDQPEECTHDPRKEKIVNFIDLPGDNQTYDPRVDDHDDDDTSSVMSEVILTVSQFCCKSNSQKKIVSVNNEKEIEVVSERKVESGNDRWEIERKVGSGNERQEIERKVGSGNERREIERKVGSGNERQEIERKVGSGNERREIERKVGSGNDGQEIESHSECWKKVGNANEKIIEFQFERQEIEMDSECPMEIVPLNGRQIESVVECRDESVPVNDELGMEIDSDCQIQDSCEQTIFLNIQSF